ncbi:MAG: hypothetical protein AAB401_23130 [Acidobacteriota bacterium]
MRFNFASGNWRASAILFSALMLAACGANAPKEITSDQSASPSSAASTASSAPATVPMKPSGGSEITWTPPARWEAKPASGMRAATYIVPPAKGDTDGGECAVFTNIGGGVQANIDRWIGQFEQADGGSSAAKAKQKTETINGFAVTTVDLTGTFAGGGMAMGQPATSKPNYRLLGAIVEGPSGEVFFKMTGPAKTMAAAQNEFQAMLKSVRK